MNMFCQKRTEKHGGQHGHAAMPDDGIPPEFVAPYVAARPDILKLARPGQRRGAGVHVARLVLIHHADVWHSALNT